MNNQLQPPIHAGWAWSFHWLNLSAADLIVVVLMVVVFILALVIPFPEGRDEEPKHGGHHP
ncbi:hypothetical protein LLE49_05830 [Alicyclobacillus tolerans]|uniref:hypothetical protein n=1 Tax=Alicyclobacillus tolerans TaxID=90970 RepID=UPI001F24FC00|nr:hypothetical protein [Alicyclobacillus tolerans]MCF8564261.1 hypothetical protein [Alicyclobacillus tolerans]